ncbi:MAG: hypothetical protein HQ553_12560 [Chloroflexi bacterium]|nr:hypothetical protein [Chloroflexota bacterium]
MANGVLLIGWKRPVPGREQQAMDLFQRVTEYYANSQSEGKIENFEPVILNHHGGDLNGFFLIKGDSKKLSEFRHEDTFVDYAIEAGYCLEGFGVVGGAFGEKVSDNLALWSKHIGK